MYKISAISEHPLDELAWNDPETSRGEWWYIYVFEVFFQCWNKKLDCRQMNGSWSKNIMQYNSVNKSELLICLPTLPSCIAPPKFLLNCIYCTNIEIIKFTVVLDSIRKNISFSSFNLYFKCKFNLVLLFIFLSKHKALYKQNFPEHFSNKVNSPSLVA